MKTPRELLLQRHHSARLRLDAVRQNALAHVRNTSTSRDEQVSRSLWFFWQEALLSLRWHMAGLSALWLLIALLNSEPAAAPTAVAANRTSTPTQLLAAVRENRRQVLELINDPIMQSAAAPQPFVPRPRSERQPVWTVV